LLNFIKLEKKTYQRKKNETPNLKHTPSLPSIETFKSHCRLPKKTYNSPFLLFDQTKKTSFILNKRKKNDEKKIA